MTKFNNLFNIASLNYRDKAVMMTSNSRKVLNNIVDRFQHIKSLDDYDYVYGFYLKRMEQITVGIDEDEVDEFLKDNPNAVKNGEDEFELSAEILFRIVVGRLNVPNLSEGTEQLCYIMVEPILSTNLRKYLYFLSSTTVHTKNSAYDDVFPDDNDYKVIDIETPLLYIDEFLSEKLKDKESVEKFNEESYKWLPSEEKEFIVERDKIPHMRYDVEVSKAKLDILANYVSRHDEKVVLTANDIINGITPKDYIKVWNILHIGSYAESVKDSVKTVDDKDFFACHNAKGYELIQRLNTEEDWSNSAILREWYDENKYYHCCDVVYARTSLYCFGLLPMRYSVSTHWHIDAFVNGIIRLDEELGTEEAKKLVSISDDIFETVENLYLNRDVIKYSKGYEDKYLRPSMIDYNGAEYPSYCRCSLMFLEDEEKDAIFKNGIELPWKYRLLWKE